GGIDMRLRRVGADNHNEPAPAQQPEATRRPGALSADEGRRHAPAQPRPTAPPASPAARPRAPARAEAPAVGPAADAPQARAHPPEGLSLRPQRSAPPDPQGPGVRSRHGRRGPEARRSRAA